MNAVRTKRAHYIHGEERKPTENEPADDNRERLRGFSLHPEALHLRLNVPLAHPPRHHFGLVPVVARARAGAWGPLDAVAAARPPRRGPPARVKPLHAELVLPPVQARRGGVLPVDGVVHGVAGLRGGAAGGDGQQVRVGRRRQVVARGVAHADLDPLVPAPRRRARTDAAGGGGGAVAAVAVGRAVVALPRRAAASVDAEREALLVEAVAEAPRTCIKATL